jgi:hypothetical protein
LSVFMPISLRAVRGGRFQRAVRGLAALWASR